MWPGVAVALGVGVVTTVIHHRFTAVSAHVLAVLVGVAAANLGRVDPVLRPGLRMAARRVLRMGVALLGLRLSLAQFGELGPRALGAVVVVVAATFVGTRWLAARMGVGRGLGLLVATGYSICGASAIAAMEPLADSDDESVAYALALVTMCGTLSIAVLPPIGHLVHLGDARFGAWVGAAVHDVGQVVATASTRSPAAIRTATLVKLARVALLAPLLAMVAMRRRRTVPAAVDGAAGAAVDPRSSRVPVVPLFMVGFFVAMAVRSTGWLPERWLDRGQTLETVLLAAGLFGLGTGVDVRRLARVGGRPLVLGLASWALVAGASLGAVRLAGF